MYSACMRCKLIKFKFQFVLIQFLCDVGSELFRKDADAEQKHSSLQDDLMKARLTLCSLTDKVKYLTVYF